MNSKINKILFAGIMLAATLSMNVSAKGLFKKKELKAVVPAIVMANELDTMSYALGANVGYDFAEKLKTLPEGKYNLDLFVQGLNAALKGDSVYVSKDSIGQILNAYFTKAKEKESGSIKSEGEKFLAENAARPGVVTTLTGLQYEVVKDTLGPKPLATDRVKVHYEGTLLDGTKFDSSYDRGEPIDFTLNQVIKGWTEGVMLMSPGAKYKFYIPYNLGYGEQGAGGVIPPYATLIFTVELLEINPVTIKDQVKEMDLN